MSLSDYFLRTAERSYESEPTPGSDFQFAFDMLQGSRLCGKGSIDVQEIETNNNLGNGLCIVENAQADVGSITIESNKGGGLTMGDSAVLDAGSISQSRNFDMWQCKNHGKRHTGSRKH